MSNLARYFLLKGANVGGYDRAKTELTGKLTKEGALVHYEDNPLFIPVEFKDKANTLIVYTPAVPATHKELNYFRENGFTVLKRAQLLGEITSRDAICVANCGKQPFRVWLHIFQHLISTVMLFGGILKNIATYYFQKKVITLLLKLMSTIDRFIVCNLILQ